MPSIRMEPKENASKRMGAPPQPLSRRRSAASVSNCGRILESEGRCERGPLASLRQPEGMFPKGDRWPGIRHLHGLLATTGREDARQGAVEKEAGDGLPASTG